MISKRILISSIVIISLVQFITCAEKVKPGAVLKAAAAGAKANVPKSAEPPAGNAVNGLAEVIDPDKENSDKSDKPNGLRQKLLKPIKVIFWPIRYIWEQLKNMKNKLDFIKKAQSLTAPLRDMSNGLINND